MITPPRRTVVRLSLAGSLLSCGLAGCATVVHGTSQVVPIVSTPSGARVAIDDVPVGETPLMASVARGRSHTVTLTRDSLPAVNVRLTHRLSGWVVANMFVYYAPALIDFADGAAYQFDDDTMRVVFRGYEATSEMRRFGFAGDDQVRFIRSGSDNRFVRARVDSASAQHLYLHASSNTTSTTYDAPAIVPLSEVTQLDFLHPRAGARNAESAAHYTSLVTWGLPVAVGVAVLQPGIGLALGGVYTLAYAPLGYGVGAVIASDRWSPWEAHRAGSPLLVDDRLRVRLADGDRTISGRLMTIDTADVIVRVGHEATRLPRTSIRSMQRADGFDYRTGARRGLVIGTIIGAVTGAQQGQGGIYNPDGPAMFVGAGLGAVVGLLGTTALAPRKWVEVLKW